MHFGTKLYANIVCSELLLLPRIVGLTTGFTCVTILCALWMRSQPGRGHSSVPPPAALPSHYKSNTHHRTVNREPDQRQRTDRIAHPPVGGWVLRGDPTIWGWQKTPGTRAPKRPSLVNSSGPAPSSADPAETRRHRIQLKMQLERKGHIHEKSVLWWRCLVLVLQEETFVYLMHFYK